MFRFRTASLAAVALAVTGTPAAGQWIPQSRPGPSGGLSSHVGLALGIGVEGLSYTRSLMVPTARDYVVNFTGVADPTGRFTADLGATLRPGERLSYSAYATATTRDRNSFYGWGNATSVSGVSDFHRLDQFRFETGVAARLSFGDRNEITAGPFFRQTRTADAFDLDDREGTPADATGVMLSLQPYGSGSFSQIGFRTDVRVATEGPESGRNTGVRFYGGGTAYPAALDMREPVLALYGNTKAFLKVTAPLDPVLYVGAAVERVFGEAPFQDAAYLGGRRSLRGFEKQRFAGDLALLGSTELYARVGSLRVRERPVTLGFMLLADAGRMFQNGLSEGSTRIAAGGGLWLRDEITGTEVTISVADGGAGPRLYVGVGSAFWR